MKASKNQKPLKCNNGGVNLIFAKLLPQKLVRSLPYLVSRLGEGNPIIMSAK